MRGLPRMLMMFAPMIIRQVMKMWNKRSAAKQREEFVQEPYNEVQDRVNPDKGTYKEKDMV